MLWLIHADLTAAGKRKYDVRAGDHTNSVIGFSITALKAASS